ncbi:TPM domain-containing protein [Mucilaginibacter myungsuensis]|uniref:TPM domain-containing protein n=1 Tax=Mucilaginibacter myungsuensis TaxID=649104 RepID=A0A929KVY2_9SPHI|nr:TPM domain-containing protein [Mucilaginibacter myungsuensis]MBE9660893.1 TPM domain-containing protein [Mucilaginibacter myungsuensis]MDN3600940.1 TPM domain-containing protein [Mucilaginibacter myungsuensis]
MRRFALSLLIISISFTAFNSSAQIPKPKKNSYVNDLAGVLTADEETELNKEIFTIERKRDVQMAIVLVKKIPSMYDIEEFAVLIGRRWGVGKNKRGIVYVAAIDQRKQRIEVARNLDELFPNDVSLALLDRVKPGFREKDYKAGLSELISGVEDILPLSAAEQKLEQVRADSVQAVVKQAAIAREKADAIVAESDRQLWKWFAVFLSVLLVIYVIRKLINRSSSSYETIRNTDNYVGDGNYGSSGYSSSRRYNSYGSYGGGYRSSGSRLGDFATGAAAGYAARTLQERSDEERRDRQRREEDERRDREERDREEDDRREQEAHDREANEPRNWGNWGGGSSDSGGGSSSSDGNSGNSGFSTGSSSGATSDW